MEQNNQKYRMLLIEDEDDLRAILEEYLRESGFDVESFPSAEKALPYWEQHREEIELVLTDIRMPGSIDGVGSAQRTRNHPDRQPAIVMISGFEPPPKELLNKLGVTEFLSKPFRVSELSRLCKNKIAKSSEQARTTSPDSPISGKEP